MDGQAVIRAEAAKRFLDDPVVQEAFVKAEQTFIAEWRDATDPDLRELAWAKVQGIDEVKRQLRIHISTGEYALIAGNRQRESVERLSRKR